MTCYTAQLYCINCSSMHFYAAQLYNRIFSSKMLLQSCMVRRFCSDLVDKLRTLLRKAQLRMWTYLCTICEWCSIFKMKLRTVQHKTKFERNVILPRNCNLSGIVRSSTLNALHWSQWLTRLFSTALVFTLYSTESNYKCTAKAQFMIRKAVL